MLFAIAAFAGWLLHVIRPPTPTAATAAATCSAPATPSNRARVSVAETRSLAESPEVLVVDARARVEFVTGHIAGAVSVPAGDDESIRTALPTLRGAATVITYCEIVEACSCADELATRLVEEGIRDVRVLAGGLQAWLAAGHPAEAGGCSL